MGTNPGADSDDYTSLGKAVTYLSQCFFNEIHCLVGSESQHHMHNSAFHFDTQLRAAEEHITSAVAPLRKLAESDLNLTPGNECAIPNLGPNLTCRTPSFPVSVRLVQELVTAEYHSSEPGLIMKVGVISIIQAWSRPVLNYDLMPQIKEMIIILACCQSCYQEGVSCIIN